MAKYTIRINRAAPKGSDWQELNLTFRTERAATVELVRLLDREYPGSWELNGQTQFIVKASYAGSHILAEIDEQDDRIEYLEQEIERYSALLQTARAELRTLKDRVDDYDV